jgi:hypothetical protein
LVQKPVERRDSLEISLGTPIARLQDDFRNTGPRETDRQKQFPWSRLCESARQCKEPVFRADFLLPSFHEMLFEI